MSWNGPVLDEEQEAVFEMLNDLEESLVGEAGSPIDVDTARQAVLETGIWALSSPEDYGGAEAELSTALLALERLGRFSPSLGWASAQAQAAISVTAKSAQPETSESIAEGQVAVAVVEAASSNVRLTQSGDHWSGQIDRVDMAAESGMLIVLNGSNSAAIFNEDALTFQSQQITGLAGAKTQSVVVADVQPELVELDLQPTRALLYLGAAAVATGISGAAADAAKDYAVNRTQFGASLTQIPVVRQSLAEQITAVAQSINTVMSANAASLTQIVGALQLATENAVEVTGLALQSHGGYGYLDEYPVGSYVRNALSLRSAIDTFAVSRQAALSHVDLPLSSFSGGNR